MATLEQCVKPVLMEKADEEILKEMLVISIHGKEYLQLGNDEAKEALKQKTIAEKQYELALIGKHLTKEGMINEIIMNMDGAIKEGIGFFDYFREMDKYARQLEECLILLTKALKKKAEEERDENWIKEIEKVEKKYSNISNYSCTVAQNLEQDIVTLLVDAYIRTLPPNERDKLYKEIEEAVKEYADKIGVDVPDVQIGVILAQGGLIALKSILGFQFHILLAIIANTIWNITGGLIVGKGLSLAINALIQRIAAIALGPIGWIITIIIILPLITKLLNPREFDKYLPLVVYVYLLRHIDEFKEVTSLPE